MGDIKTRFALEGEQQFKSAMSSAAAAIKVLNSEQKLAKAQFQNTGNAEKYAADQARILKEKIEQQKTAVKAAEQALKQLADNGVAKNTRQYQQWQTKLNSAQTALVQMETELQNVNSTMEETASTANEAGDAINSIGKKVSFDAVIGGIGKITDKMEAAARKAKELATDLMNTMKDSAAWADDLATTATVYGISQEELQRMRYTADLLDTSVESIMKSRQKLINNMVYGNAEVQETFKTLGIATQEFTAGKYGPVATGYRDWQDVFWETGQALMELGDYELASAYATKIFGKSWAELLPLFDNDWAEKGFGSAREYYEATMDSWDVVSDENIAKLTALDDALHTLENNFTTLKETVLAQLAPAFTAVADTISKLLTEFNKYLETDEGKQKLQDLSEAVTKLFTGLTEVDFGAALELAKGAIDSLTSGLEWLAKPGNLNAVKQTLEALAIAFGALKVSETVLTFMQLLAAGKFLLGGTAASEAAAAGTTAGTAWGSAFAAAVMKAAPWLAFAYTLLNPASTAGNDLDVLFNEQTGQLTTAGWDDYNQAIKHFNETGEHDWNGWIDDLLMVGDLFGDLARITADDNAINAIAKYRMHGDTDQLIRDLEALGYTKRPTEEELRIDSGVPETVRVDESGHMYDANGNVIGFQMPKNDGPVYHRDRRTGELIQAPEPEPVSDYKLWDSDEIVAMTEKQAEAVERFWDVWKEKGSDFTDADYDAYADAFEGQQELFDRVDELMNRTWDEHNAEGDFPEDLFEVEAQPTLPTDAGSIIQEKLNALRLTAVVQLIPSFSFGGVDFTPHANGLWSVPWDGYPAILHKGEQVVPAREVARGSQNYSSNLYVESMYMNNGTDADGLAAAMAAAQRRTLAGYGS